MVSAEKLSWIKEKSRRNDKRVIERQTGVEYYIVVDILRGRYYGEHGPAVIEAAEKLINKRERRLAAEREKYALK